MARLAEYFAVIGIPKASSAGTLNSLPTRPK